jgi:hypothetical protein
VKKLFLSSSSGYKWDQIKTWNMSAKKTEHDVCNLLINPSQELVDCCNEHGVSAVGYNLQQMNKPPHNLRFLLQYKYLISVKDIYSHVVLTDSRDVYFHSDPFPRLIELLGSRNIICGSECIAYQDEHWGNGNLKEGFGYVYDEYKTSEICNVGVLCGTIEAVAELCLMIFTMCYHNPASVSDQSSFNILMGTEFGRKSIGVVRPSDGLMVHLGTVGIEKFQLMLTEKPQWGSDELPSANGKVIPIIHQYDRVDTSKWGVF